MAKKSAKKQSKKKTTLVDSFQKTAPKKPVDTYTGPEIQDMPEPEVEKPKVKKVTDENVETIRNLIDSIEEAPDTTIKKPKKSKEKKKISVKTEPKAIIVEETSETLVTADSVNPDTPTIVEEATKSITVLDLDEEEPTEQPEEEIPEETPEENPETEESPEDASAPEEPVKSTGRTMDGVIGGKRNKKPADSPSSIDDDDYSEAELSELLSDFNSASAETDNDYSDLIDDLPEPKNEELKSKKDKKSLNKSKVFRIASRVLAIITSVSIIMLLVRLITAGLQIPNRYFIPAILVITMFILIYFILSFRKKTAIALLIVLDILGVICTTGCIFAYTRLDEAIRFLESNFGETKVVSIYNVIVAKDSSYNDLKAVRGKTIHSIGEFIDKEKVEAAVKKNLDAPVEYLDNIGDIFKNTAEDKEYVSLVNESSYNTAIEIYPEYADKLKIIGTIEVESKERSTNFDGDVTTTPFILYISGIDTRENIMPEHQLSDVNILMVINPNTKHILMVNVPRDYYVQLHGTSGSKDKLTHAGMLGGVDLSIDTIQDILGIQISHYMRVNFFALTGLVDAIGGITINSDLDHPFLTHNNGCYIYPGDNEVDGNCALGFARERKAYQSGDLHRGENQEQVITKIIQKTTKSSTLISNYSSILASLSGSFETSLSQKDITSLINMQINDMSSWKIDNQNLSGDHSSETSYAFPGQYLTVIIPNKNTIKEARFKIQEILNETK